MTTPAVPQITTNSSQSTTTAVVQQITTTGSQSMTAAIVPQITTTGSRTTTSDDSVTMTITDSSVTTTSSSNVPYADMALTDSSIINEIYTSSEFISDSRNLSLTSLVKSIVTENLPFIETTSEELSTTDSSLKNDYAFTTDMLNFVSSSTNCECPCSIVKHKWDFLRNLSLTKDKLRLFLKDYLNELQNGIAINKKQTSFYIYTKISMRDDRVSAMATGCFGIVVVSIPVVLIVCSDILKCLMWKSRKKSNLG